jgi:hypothetical protein
MGEEKEKYNIVLDGCDDSTKWPQELSKREVEFLEKICEKSKEVSTYECMPRMRIEKRV